MDKEKITLQEVANDGQSIFLYYDTMVGVYTAYGLSAYYTTMVTEPFMSYSEEMQMPVALLRRENVLYLRQSLKKVEHTVKTSYKFRMRIPIGNAGYDKWARKIRDKHSQVNAR